MKIKKVGVIGSGQMGTGITQVIAQAGIQVVMRDIEDKFVAKGMQSIKASLMKNIERNVLRIKPIRCYPELEGR